MESHTEGSKRLRPGFGVALHIEIESTASAKAEKEFENLSQEVALSASSAAWPAFQMNEEKFMHYESLGLTKLLSTPGEALK